MAQWPDATDRRPGGAPDIWDESGDVLFAFPVVVSTRSGKNTQLILRCTRDGDLWAVIVQDDWEPKRGE